MTGNTLQKQVYLFWSADGINMVPVTLTNPLPIQGTIAASNPSVGTTGAAAPTSATEIGIIVGGNLQGVSAGNPLPITGSISASNPSVGSTGAAVPASGTYIAANVGGNLTGLGATANGLKIDGSAVTQPVSGSISVSNFPATQPVSGSVSLTGVTNNINNVSGTVSLPTNAAQETGGNLATIAGSVSAGVSQDNLKQVNGITVLTGTGATGTGCQRVTVAGDTATIAGSAPGTAGAASANVLTVQGVASMTKLLVTPDSVALPANQSVNVSQVNGVTTLTGAGATGTGSQRTTVAQDTTTIAGSAVGTAGSASANVVSVQGIASGTNLNVNLAASALTNQSVNVAQIGGNAVVASVTGVQNVAPIKRTGTTGLAENFSSITISTKTTTTITASTCYLSSMIYTCTSAGTSWTMTIQDGEGTPKVLVPSFTLAASTVPQILINLTEPIVMTTGIAVVTAGTTAGSLNMWTTYWQ